jgi:hypothetical protein
MGVVTGPNIFRFFRLDDSFQSIEVKQTSVVAGVALNYSPAGGISTNYTCHTWTPYGQIAICTDMGDILLLDGNGQMVEYIVDSPRTSV